MLRWVAICLVAGFPTAAFSQDDDQPRNRREITLAQATQIARGYGMVEVEEIERDDGGWEVEGRDRHGRSVDVTINAEGRVTRVERDDDDD